MAHVDLSVLTRQRDAAAALAEGATSRGWDAETERHRRLITGLNRLVDRAGHVSLYPEGVWPWDAGRRL